MSMKSSSAALCLVATLASTLFGAYAVTLPNKLDQYPQLGPIPVQGTTDQMGETVTLRITNKLLVAATKQVTAAPMSVDVFHTFNGPDAGGLWRVGRLYKAEMWDSTKIVAFVAPFSVVP